MQAITTYFNLLEDREDSLEQNLETIYEENKEKNPYLAKIENPDMHFHIVTKEKESIESACHDVIFKKESTFYNIYESECLSIPSMHSFTLARIPNVLKIVGKSTDDIVEAVEYTENNCFILGIQGHLELLEDKRIFEWLIKRCNIKYQILVNKQYGLKEENDFEIKQYTSLYSNCIHDGNMEIGVYPSWSAFRDYVRENGYFIDVESAFRETELQKRLYEENVQKYGIEHANIFVARPRHSEHETGLAIDVTMRTKDGKWVIEFDPEFLECQQFLKENCSRFGFVLRYPEYKEEITGYHYEPWYFRYVGNKKVAEYIMKNNLCLEEYYEKEKIFAKNKNL